MGCSDWTRGARPAQTVHTHALAALARNLGRREQCTVAGKSFARDASCSCVSFRCLLAVLINTSMPHASLAPDGAPVGRRHTFLPPRLIRMIDVLQDGEMCDQPRIALAMTRSERVDRCTIASPRSVRHVSTGAGAISARDVGSTGLSASIPCSLLLRLRARRERRSRLAVPTMTHAEHPHR